jgi:hypothetical protein
MQSNGKSINGQHTNSPSFLDLLDQTPPPPLPDLEDVPRTKRFAGLREAWNASWEQGGFLRERWEELLQGTEGRMARDGRPSPDFAVSHEPWTP